ncbi:MAG: glutamine amidotransferase [Wolbachia endosymbiont of Menacanthus eurysternus]|nr:MAG: glutamine amidotransferase [Wolbachia endosymbiont of Menacanthus eurysternus]
MFNILLCITLLFSSISCAYTCEDSYSVTNDIIVGLLKVEEKYLYEVNLFRNICEMFDNLKIKIVLIDYIKIIDFKKIKAEIINLIGLDGIFIKKIVLDKVKVEIVNFIKESKINRIFILGNYCNSYYYKSFPSIYYQLIIEAIIKIIDDNPAIHLLCVCGALQAVVRAKGIEIVNMSSFISDERILKSASKMACLKQENIFFQKVKVVPNSHLAKVLVKFLPFDENGWFSMYVPNIIYSEILSNTLENRKRLESLGYKIVAFSNDGVAEVIEDRYGNIYFQNCPEIFILNLNENYCLSNYKTCQISTLIAMAIINDFLYRA